MPWVYKAMLAAPGTRSAFDGVLGATVGLLEDPQRRQRRGGHRRARGFQLGMTPGRPIRELSEHVRPAFGAEVQHAAYVADQLVVEGMARLDVVEQVRGLLVALGLGQGDAA